MIYDLVVIGATFAGLGAAYAEKGNVLAVERRSQIGYEFIGAYNPATAWILREAETEEGGRLKNELIKEGILSDDMRIYMPEVQSFLYYRIYRDRLPVLLMTEVIAVEKQQGIYEIEIYNASGISRLTAKRVLDTTEGLSLRPEDRPKILRKSINAFLYGGEEAETIPAEEGMQIFPANRKGEALLSLELDVAANYIYARQKLHDRWIRRKKSLASWTIALMADCMGIVLDRRCFAAAEGHVLLCSACFENPLEAFEAGIKFIEGVKDHVAV